jgi:Transposase DDE domain group 1
VHSAHGWREVLDPWVARYRGQAVRRLLRSDAAFAFPDVYEYLEAEGFPYTIRLPANQVLQAQIAPLLTRSVGPRTTSDASTRASAIGRRAGTGRVASWRRWSGTPASCTRAWA